MYTRQKLFIIIALLFLTLSVYLKPRLEIAPRLSLYHGETYLSGGTPNLGLGVDVILNPTNNIGLRLTLSEFLFGENTVFILNSEIYKSMSTLDFLYYVQIGGLKSYINAGLGIHTHHGRTHFALETGIGLQHYIGGGKTLFLEPNLVIFSPNDYDGPDYAVCLSVGFRFPVMK